MVSIIIPVFNCAKFLRRSVESVLNQTYRNIECIIVDDGSTDGKTSQLCDELEKEDARIMVIHKENGGAAQAREWGVKVCKGSSVMFVDADDYLDLGIIEICVNRMKMTSADMICFDYVLNKNGKNGSSLLKIYKEELIDNIYALKCMFTRHKLDGNMVHILYSRNLLDGIKYETRRNSEFVSLALILEKSSGVLLVPYIGYFYCVVEGSQTRNKSCHPKEEEFAESSFELFQRYISTVIKVEAEYFWLYALLYVCMKMEKDANLSRKSKRFKAIKECMRKEGKTYFKNPYITIAEKVKYILCYTNMFRPAYKILMKLHIIGLDIPFQKLNF